jgi:hypothetical protein
MKYWIYYCEGPATEDTGLEEFDTPEDAAQWIADRRHTVTDFDLSDYTAIRGERLTLDVARVVTKVRLSTRNGTYL